MASRLQAYALWRFTESLDSSTTISEESICELLQIACTEITERVREDPLRSHILWHGGCRIDNLQGSDMFRQLLCDIPNLGAQLCLWVNKAQPPSSHKPIELQYERFQSESEYDLEKLGEIITKKTE